MDTIGIHRRYSVAGKGTAAGSWRDPGGRICGLPYVRKKHDEQLNFKLLAAPVIKHRHYGAVPVYYSDVVVHADSSFRSFEDLWGRTWAYNEPGSHSGYNIVRYPLAIRGSGTDFFGRVVESGSHQSSLRCF
ncbi:MAG: hypothetical protein DMG13_22555 [Acidobacteria bacterium]|nr:MAG: hypothetical protein DMG13_22555 [Acidobacteriota bacterium]